MKGKNIKRLNAQYSYKNVLYPYCDKAKKALIL